MTAAPGAFVALTVAALKNSFRGDEGAYEQFMENHPDSVSPFTNCQDFTCLHARVTADNALRALDAAGFDVVEATS